jgi:hypothetical protein
MEGWGWDREVNQLTGIGEINKKDSTEAEGVAQEKGHLLCKHEALSSNPSPTKKKKKLLMLKV